MNKCQSNKNKVANGICSQLRILEFNMSSFQHCKWYSKFTYPGNISNYSHIIIVLSGIGWYIGPEHYRSRLRGY